MSEKEFELYLSLLSRFLRLKSAQRGEIADELRDHLEARLEELSRTGLSREDAIHAALEEFGDATELAQHFTQIAVRRKRRFIMRCTVGTVAALTAGILFTTAFWPANQGMQLAPIAVGQQAEKQAGAANFVEAQKSPRSSSGPKVDDQRDITIQREIEQRLQMPITLSFADASLKSVLEYLSVQGGVNIMLDGKSLRELGLEPSEEIVSLKCEQVKLETALQLLLDPFKLAYRVWDGSLYVESQEIADQHGEVRIYNCRDLIDENAGRDAKSLIGVIASYSDGGFWEVAHREGGSITEFHGLLIVRNSQQAHRGMVHFLEMLRAADKEISAPRFGSAEANAHTKSSADNDAMKPVERRVADEPRSRREVPNSKTETPREPGLNAKVPEIPAVDETKPEIKSVKPAEAPQQK